MATKKAKAAQHIKGEAPKTSSKKPRVNSFFAGIGGFDLGFDRAGISTSFHCEINSFCTSVLRRHWPAVPCVPNILELKAEEIPDAEVWCGGFPCQDVSVARGWLGRDGLSGKNTGLFYPFAELVKQKLPPVVLMENVSGLLNSHDGRDFAVILQTFQMLGYGVAWRIFNTRYFGAPQSRPRVYICAWKGSAINALNVLYEAGHTALPESARLGFLRPTVCEETGAHVPEVAFCLAATSGRHTGTDWSRSYISYHDEVRRLTPTECEKLQGFPEGWTFPHEDFHLSDDAIDTMRYHAIGNAVSVPVVEWVAKRIRAELKVAVPKAKGAEPADAVIDYAKSRVPDFASAKATTVQIETFVDRDNAPKIKWNNGGVMFDGLCHMSPVSPAPKKPVHSRVVDSLDKVKPSARYFLSPNAATGILRRVNSQDRTLFQPLEAALQRLAKKAP
ncbi:DNA cytosine methyltransferase [Rhodoferax sp. BLA1]|uniref:DNA cytosine methyltransferase n=1 Tax=Rhodoferax sp. BLA1 TaxID=2576062 RepID=UPI0015D38D91|nr:DNA (cytosine-5-)-methyltransferase [Rhodoferax sp. BLA1]